MIKFLIFLVLSCSQGVTKKTSHKCKGKFVGVNSAGGNNFENKDLQNQRFANMNFSYGCFVDANLKNAVFNYSDLTNAIFEDANVRGTSFKCTNITNADFLKAKNLKAEQLKTAYGYSVKLPNGLSVPQTKQEAGCDENPFGKEVNIQFIDEAK